MEKSYNKSLSNFPFFLFSPIYEIKGVYYSVRMYAENYYTLTKQSTDDIYVTDPGVVQFDLCDSLYNHMLLITAATGRGKTTYVFTKLLQDINQRGSQLYADWKPLRYSDILFLTSRMVIRKQQIATTDNARQAFTEDFFHDGPEDNNVLVTTAHHFG